MSAVTLCPSAVVSVFFFYVPYLAGDAHLRLCQAGKLALFLEAQYVPIFSAASTAIYTASGQFTIASVKEMIENTVYLCD